jgi:hypothetical protein
MRGDTSGDEVFGVGCDRPVVAVMAIALDSHF